MRSLYQDRLGTNIGKALKNRYRFSQVFEPIARCFLDAGEPAAAASAAMEVNQKKDAFLVGACSFSDEKRCSLSRQAQDGRQECS